MKAGPYNTREAILRLACTDGSTRFFKFSGNVEVWDSESSRVDPKFKWHELKSKENVEAIQGPPPRADGKPVELEPWEPVDLSK
jgi:hypothetical protein